MLDFELIGRLKVGNLVVYVCVSASVYVYVERWWKKKQVSEYLACACVRTSG